MSSNKIHRLGAAPLLVLGLAAPALFASGCGDDLGGDCAAEIATRFESLNAAVNGLIEVSGELKADVSVACYNIASELGESPPEVGDGSDVSDEDLQAACASATAALQAEFDAGVEIFVAVEGGKCEVNASAQFECEANCDVSGECTPGSLEARCEPGKLSGECSAECSGSCTVESGSVECAGACEGTCSGDCSGTCSAENNMGECEGICEGECTGSCSGTCEVVAPSATCSGECTGECSADFEAPSCTGTVEPPACDIDADCQAGCDGQAKFEAECTPPSITVEINGGGSANLKAVLEANLPAIFNAFQVKGELVVSAAGDVAAAFPPAAEAVVSSAGCALQYGADFAGSIAGSAEASASVNVSVSASADVGGTAQGG